MTNGVLATCNRGTGDNVSLQASWTIWLMLEPACRKTLEEPPRCGASHVQANPKLLIHVVPLTSRR